ncbi:hypothetical protein D3C75_1368270 [compost metagenome]
MSPDLAFEKICVLILLLSVIPGFYWGWQGTRDEDLPARIFLASCASLLPPTAIATVALILVCVAAAVAFIIS